MLRAQARGGRGGRSHKQSPPAYPLCSDQRRKVFTSIPEPHVCIPSKSQESSALGRQILIGHRCPVARPAQQHVVHGRRAQRIQLAEHRREPRLPRHRIPCTPKETQPLRCRQVTSCTASAFAQIRPSTHFKRLARGFGGTHGRLRGVSCRGAGRRRPHRRRSHTRCGWRPRRGQTTRRFAAASGARQSAALGRPDLRQPRFRCCPAWCRPRRRRPPSHYPLARLQCPPPRVLAAPAQAAAALQPPPGK